MQKRRDPARMASSRFWTETSRPTKPRDSARDFRMPKTTGVMEMDSACLTRWPVSPTFSQRELAGQTAS